MPKHRKSFGLVLREMRELAGLSSHTLGERLGCGEAQVLRWENNQARFHAGTLKPYSQLLNIDPHILLCEYLYAEAQSICERSGIEFLFTITPVIKTEALWEGSEHENYRLA